MLYFCLASDNNIYNLCDCGDYEAAHESAYDILVDPDIKPVWIIKDKISTNKTGKL